MKKIINLSVVVFGFSLFVSGCATNDRSPQGRNRSGRTYKEPQAMNHRTLNTENLYQACIKERPEVSCRNRLGR